MELIANTAIQTRGVGSFLKDAKTAIAIRLVPKNNRAMSKRDNVCARRATRKDHAIIVPLDIMAIQIVKDATVMREAPETCPTMTLSIAMIMVSVLVKN
jgi:hypothetical protein